MKNIFRALLLTAFSLSLLNICTTIESEHRLYMLETRLDAIDSQLQNLQDKTFLNVKEYARYRIYYVFTEKSQGTGFQIYYKGREFIVSNAHVCKDFKEVDLQITRDTPIYKRKVIKLFKVYDLCIIEPIEGNLSFALSERPPFIGENVAAIGHPRGKELALTYGEVFDMTEGTSILAEKDEKCIGEGLVLRGGKCYRDFDKVTSTTVLMLPGSSGSPLVTINGQVVGVVFLYDSLSGWASVVPYEYLKKALEVVSKDR